MEKLCFSKKTQWSLIILEKKGNYHYLVIQSITLRKNLVTEEIKSLLGTCLVDYLKGAGPMNPFTIAGSFEAFGGSSGTGATADRNVFGWCATYQGDMCGSYHETTSSMNTTTTANMP